MIRWQPGYVYPPVFHPPHYPLGPLDAILFLLIAVAVGALTFRRPALGIGALIICLPFADARYAFDTSITIPKAAFVGFVTALLIQRPSLAVLRTRVVILILLAFATVLATIALSCVSALHPGAVVREFAKWAEYTLTFLAVAIAFGNDSDDRPIWWSLIVMALLESAYAVLQLAIGAPSGVLVRGHVLPRVAGSLEGPNQFAGWLNLVLPVLFARMLVHRDRWLVAAVIMTGTATALTLSRSGIAAAFLGVAITILVTRPPKRVGLRLATGAAILIAVLVSAGLLVGFETHFFSLAEVPQPDHLGTRSILWSSAIELWQRSPLTGIGAGNFELDLGMVGHPEVQTHANSLYLQFLSETGIVGLAAILFLIYASTATFAQSYSRRPLVIGIFAGTVAIALHQLFDYLWFYPKVGGLWCLLLGVGVVELLASREDAGALPVL